MFNPTSHIIEGCGQKDRYNCLTVSTHERYQGVGLAKTKCDFYMWMKTGVFKPGWNTSFNDMPENHILLDERRGDTQLYPWVNIDFAFSQNKFGQFQILGQIAQAMHVPMISLEHTCFMPWWDDNQRKQLNEMRGNINVFITEYQLDDWGWEDRGDTYVINHCVDTDLFQPNLFKRGNSMQRENRILTVGNDYIGRDSVLNFSQFKRVVLDNRLPYRSVGDTKGFSTAPNSVQSLVQEYNSSRIFLNTHHISPIPTSLLEAMSMECAVVSCDTCAIPTYIKHGENGFLYNNDEEALEYLKLLLNDKKLAEQMGVKARQTIQEKCKVEDFVQNWNNIFDLARKMK
jgi:glycosyltransferase involved in cell wall biosynthesis